MYTIDEGIEIELEEPSSRIAEAGLAMSVLSIADSESPSTAQAHKDTSESWKHFHNSHTLILLPFSLLR